jgi:hypothetical protein
MPRHDQTGGCADYVFSLAKGHRIKLVTDKAYDTDHFVAALRNIGVTPHVAQNNTTGSLPSMAAPPGTAVTPFHCGSERGLKRSLAGPEPAETCARRGTDGRIASHRILR